MKVQSRKSIKVVYALAVLIILSLVVEYLLTSYFNDLIHRNDEIRKEAERAKVETVDIIGNIHLLDLALRGYALVPDNRALSAPIDSAIQRNEVIFGRLETSLKALGYPMERVKTMRDSTAAYITFAKEIRSLIAERKEAEFLRLFALDRGYQLFIKHREFSNDVNAFANQVSSEALSAHDQAERAIDAMHIIIPCLVIPVILFTVYFSSRILTLSEKLRESESEKNVILTQQNETLERLVLDRTNEILTQNEEIKAQNEEIISHNEQLVMQQEEIQQNRAKLAERNQELEEIHKIIESQNVQFREKNMTLAAEVEQYTEGLRDANKELLEHNTRLEQFAYIISHNLRAPIARLIGLTSLIQSSDKEELDKIHAMILQSSSELDGIVKDLTTLLAIQRLSPAMYDRIDLQRVITKIMSILEKDIRETKTVINLELASPILFSIGAYVESILLNLITNAIKYRHPDRHPVILIKSFSRDSHVNLVLEDNGLGIDLERHQDSLFNLYKRFHFHVEGKGLGLYLVRTQTEVLGGTIEVKSEVDKGTSFHLRFPNEVMPT